jgi:mono/diheme cytochrome c family protein
MRCTKFVLSTLVATVLLAGPSLLARQNRSPESGAKVTNPVAPSKESVDAGALIYRRYCAACHGVDGKGGPPKEPFLPAPSNLIDDKYEHGSTDGDMFLVIKNGIPPDLNMDAWGERLSDTEIWNVVNYIRDLAKRP